MLTFIVRRLLIGLLVLLIASYIMYLLAASSGNPLQDLLTSTAKNKQELIQQRVDMLDLDVPPPLRYFIWLGGVLKVFVGQFTLGQDITGAAVTGQLGAAMTQTLQLIMGAEVIGVLVGVLVGITTALRQYSTYDYSVTFLSFLFFSLPVFWLAAMLKQYVAIGFNNFLADPILGPVAILVIAAISGVVWLLIIGGSARKRLITFGIAAVVTAGILFVFDLTDWFSYPSLGPVVIAAMGVGIAYLVTVLSTGLRNRRALYASLTTVAIGIALYYPLQYAFAFATGWLIFALAVLAVLVGLFVGWIFGGPDRWRSARTAAITAGLVSFVILIDRFMQSWHIYSTSSIIRGRPIATVGSGTPNLEGSFWVTGIDTFTHLLLPTVALVLVGIASYSRYARASLLEVMNQDYIRTARAKGLTERTVVMRHAFRNTLIPLTTLLTLDIGVLIGGAVVTEQVFGWTGMGNMFNNALMVTDVNSIMGFFLVTGGAIIIFNLIADVVYSALDPRIRVAS